MASSSGGSGLLVALHFHDFRAERMRHWWDLLEGNDRASIKSVFGKFSSLMRLRVDRGLLEALSPFSGIHPTAAFHRGDRFGSYSGEVC